jgi:hypothetical protein
MAAVKEVQKRMLTKQEVFEYLRKLSYNIKEQDFEPTYEDGCYLQDETIFQCHITLSKDADISFWSNKLSKAIPVNIFLFQKKGVVELDITAWF